MLAGGGFPRGQSSDLRLEQFRPRRFGAWASTAAAMMLLLDLGYAKSSSRDNGAGATNGMRWMRAVRICVILIVATLSLASPVERLGARAAEVRGCVPVGAWVVPGRKKSREDALKRLARHDVLLLGESHDEAEHHRWQLHTIAALFSYRPDMVLGFEMFPRRVQPVLDRWSKGELDEAAFLREVDWQQIWGLDPELYMPLFHFARMHRLPMLALNVDRETNRRVAQRGLAAASGEREGVGVAAPASPSYRDRLFESFKTHPAEGTEPKASSEQFSQFVQAQIFWDRAMAEAIAGARRGGRRPLVVGIMGSGHIEYGDGVARQLAALGVNDVVTALPWNADADCPAAVPRIATLLFGVAPPAATRAPPPRLGVVTSAAESGVKIEKVVTPSVAEATSLQVGDVIETAAGVAVRRPADLVAIIQRQAPGTWLPLRVRRGEAVQEMVARFPAER
jgi:uncharacterized iron-regulated protein